MTGKAPAGCTTKRSQKQLANTSWLHLQQLHPCCSCHCPWHSSIFRNATCCQISAAAAAAAAAAGKKPYYCSYRLLPTPSSLLLLLLLQLLSK
jgi:hypothetical protein